MNYMLETQRFGRSLLIRQQFETREAMVIATKILLKEHFAGHMEPFVKVDGLWVSDKETLATFDNDSLPERQMILTNASKLFATLAKDTAPSFSNDQKTGITYILELVLQVCGIQDSQEELDEGKGADDRWLNGREPSVLDATKGDFSVTMRIIPPGEAGLEQPEYVVHPEEYPA
jgi:hypothetical protein